MSQGPEYLRGPDKRRLDVLCSLGALAAGAPAFALGIGAAAIASGDGRPFFNQERDDYSGGTFTVHKLRSLNDARVASSPAGDYGTFDPRAGKIGTLLRVSGIDEFPQLINVLEGTMSVVGPRPVPANILDIWHDADPVLFHEWREVSRATKPGLLSPGTIIRKTDRVRGDVLFARSMRADLEYVDRASTHEDLRILGHAAVTGFHLVRTLRVRPAPATPHG